MWQENSSHTRQATTLIKELYLKSVKRKWPSGTTGLTFSAWLRSGLLTLEKLPKLNA
jgi:hypothetical protein